MDNRRGALKKILATALAGLLLLSPTAAWAAYAPAFQTQSQGVYLENVDTGQVIFEQNADERMEAGYLAKLMTALLTVEYMEQ